MATTLFLFLLVASMPATAQQPLSELAHPRITAAFESAERGGSSYWLIQPVLISNRTLDTLGSKRSFFDDAIDAVQYTETPFVQGYSLPLREFLRGHVELSGFSSVYSLENLMWGPPGAGNLPAWGVTAQSHVAVSAPQQATSFGMTLTLHASACDEGYLRPREWISWLVRNNRG